MSTSVLIFLSLVMVSRIETRAAQGLAVLRLPCAPPVLLPTSSSGTLGHVCVVGLDDI